MINSEPIQDLPTSPTQLFDVFKDAGIKYDLYHHDAVFTVKEAHKVDSEIEGAACRNLFLRDKKKKMFLVTAQNHTQIDLKKLEKRIASARLSFGSAERLFENLGVTPGSVCPFSVINDTSNQIGMILEEEMMAQDIVTYHPMLNTMTVALTPSDLIKFFEYIKHPFEIIDFRCVKPEA